MLAGAVGLVLLLSLVRASSEAGAGEEEVKAGSAEEEEDYVPEHEDVEEVLGPFQLFRPRYKLVHGDEDPDYFRQLGLKRLSAVRDVRKAFRQEARKFRDVIMLCSHPECFSKHRANASEADAAGNSTNATNTTKGDSPPSNVTANVSMGTWNTEPMQTGANAGGSSGKVGGGESSGVDGKGKLRVGKAWTPTLDGFKPLTEAYRVLTDPLRKRVYEVSGKRGLDGRYKPQFQDPLREPYKLEMAFKTGTFKMDFGFKEGQSKNTGNVHHNIKIPMIGFYTGFHMDVGIVRGELCPHCNGSGAAEHAEMLVCPTCKGAGKDERNTFWRAAQSPHARRRSKRYTGFDRTVTVNCANCEGTGKLASEPCPRCGGKRTLEGKVTVTVNIEPGMLEGHAFTFKEHAEQMPGVQSGDVILHVYSEDHDDFEREGSDLVTHQNITLMEALLGFKREIKHLDGRLIEIERDKVTEPGQHHEVPGLGMPIFQKPGEFGKLIVKLNILFPERIAVDEERARELRKADERSKRRKKNRFKDTDGEAAADVEDEIYDEEDGEDEEEEEDGDSRTKRTRKAAAAQEEEDEEEEEEEEEEDEEGEDARASRARGRGGGAADAGKGKESGPGAVPKVGIGMFVEPVYTDKEDEEGGAREQIGLLVKRLVPGGPAALSGAIREGDMLLKVDEEQVATMKLKQLAAHLLGQEGSDVVLTLQRGGVEDYTVTIKRGPVAQPPPPKAEL